MTDVFNDFPPQGDFLTDAHRRVLGSLTHPLAAEGVAAYLRRHDPATWETLSDVAGVTAALDDLEEHGLVKRLGEFTAPADVAPKKAAKAVAEEIVAAVADDSEVPTLHEEKAAAYVERAQRPDVQPLPARADSGELWSWTEAGREKLLAPDPRPEHNEPMTGARLDAAIEEDEQLHARWEVEAAEARERQVEGLRRRADEIEAGEEDA